MVALPSKHKENCKYMYNNLLCFPLGKKSMRISTSGQDLPNARAVSIAVTEDSGLVASRYSALNVHFGQLLSHDLDHAPQAAGT